MAADRDSLRNLFGAAGRERVRALYRSGRLRRILLVLGVLLAVYGLLGFFAAPPVLRNQLQTRLGALLERPVTLGAVHFNPYTLKLELDRVHIGARDGQAPFVDIDRLTINAAWISLFRMAPVLDALTVQHPQLHLARTGAQQFDFSDLIERFAGQPSDPKAAPARFALSNISVHDGDIAFDDQVLHARHHVDQLELGIPFIANLPHATDVFVQPLLAMRVDGRPIRIAGQTKPFADSRESVIDFRLDQLDLPRYLAYVPTPLPVAIPSGLLSGQLRLHFIDRRPTQQLQLTGTLQLDRFVLNTPGGAPIAELGRVTATLADVQPLLSRYALAALELDQASLHYTSRRGGHSNLDTLLGSNGAPAQPAAPAADVRIATLTLKDSRIIYTDQSGTQPAQLALDAINGTLHGFATLAAPPAAVDLTAGLAGGTLHLAGALHMRDSRFNGQATLAGASLAPLVALAPPLLNAEVSRGRIDARGAFVADWSRAFNLQLGGSTLAVTDFALQRRRRTPVAWKALQADITQLDLAGSKAALARLELHGLQLDAVRGRRGGIDLTRLIKTAPPQAPGKQAATPAWRWSIAHLGIDGSTLTYDDLAIPGHAGRVAVKADKFAIDGLSDDMRRPLRVDLAGSVDRGKYHVAGTVRPEPLTADLRIVATRLNVAPMQSLVQVPLNVHVNRALLSMDGRVHYRDRQPSPLLRYQGELALGRVDVLDNVTNDEFLRWDSLTATDLDVRMGRDASRISVAALALDDFYARVIVNGNGRMNLQDVVATPEAAPVSVTQARSGTPLPRARAAAPAAPAPVASATSAPAAAAPVTSTLATAAPEAAVTSALATSANVAAANAAGPAPASSAAAPVIQIGQVILARGNLNYTDNFIKPNYTANITQLAGQIGAFGTAGGGPPASLTLQGQLDDNAPITIDGTINPLTPVAFLDVKGKADGVELTHLTPYSSKYTGYPIIGGRLTVDVHYALDQGKLHADNHIFLSQLSFGDRVEGTGIKHLPVKLAVALLKDAQGNIDVDVPVSGSLSDPQFSFGGLIWRALANLIGRAVTSPFRLLASAFGGNHQDLGYVEFAPGSSALDAQAQDRLAQIAKMLAAKPSLNLDIIGRVDPQFDENGLRKVTMQEEIAHEMAKDRGGDEKDLAALAKLSADDYDKYLKKAYRHAKFPKPRDLIGLTKSQPPDVMEKLLQTNVQVDHDALQRLAERRAAAVRLWLRGKVDDKRIVVAAPKLDAKGIDGKGKTTRVDFGVH